MAFKIMLVFAVILYFFVIESQIFALVCIHFFYDLPILGSMLVLFIDHNGNCAVTLDEVRQEDVVELVIGVVEVNCQPQTLRQETLCNLRHVTQTQCLKSRHAFSLYFGWRFQQVFKLLQITTVQAFTRLRNNLVGMLQQLCEIVGLCA